MFELEIKFEIIHTDHFIRHQWWLGFVRHNKIWKKITNFSENKSIDELVTENNAIMMYNPLIR